MRRFAAIVADRERRSAWATPATKTCSPSPASTSGGTSSSPTDLRPIARDAASTRAPHRPDREVTLIDDRPPPSPHPAARDVDGGCRISAAHCGAQPALRPPAPPPGRRVRRRRPRPPRPLAAPRRPCRADPVLGDENRIRQVVANLLGNAAVTRRPARPSNSPWASTSGPAWAGSR
jgi:hypothetical protein